MKILDEKLMKNLSFPDFDVEKMEFNPEKKTLKVFVTGARLEIDGGLLLDNGFLFFWEWGNLSIIRYDHVIDKCFELEFSNAEELIDLCEVKWLNSDVFLCGFGKQIGQWVEWRIFNTKMHAEFKTLSERQSE